MVCPVVAPFTRTTSVPMFPISFRVLREGQPVMGDSWEKSWELPGKIPLADFWTEGEALIAVRLATKPSHRAGRRNMSRGNNFG
jgi:hypothetical protein